MPYIDCKLTVKKIAEAGNRQRLVEFSVVVIGFQKEKVEALVCDDELTRCTVDRLNYWIGTQRDYCQRDDLRVLGLHLYKILFDGKLKNDSSKKIDDVFKDTYYSFTQQLNTSEGDNLRLRLTLVFEDPHDVLATYPWEFIFVPVPNVDSGFFFTGERAELILTRAMASSPLVRKFEPEQSELHILVAIAKPRELNTPDDSARAEIEKLAVNIQSLNEKGRITVKTMINPTHADLVNEVKTFRPHIVHLIGHGKPGRIALFKSPSLLASEKNLVSLGQKSAIEEAEWVDGDSMRAVFNTYPPRIVFLHACNSAQAPDSLSSFKSIARHVLSAQVPAVVAMQYEISNGDASLFAATFYGQLGEGKSIDEAVNEGRKVLGELTPSWSHPRFGTPVVYLQSADLPIFAKRSGPRQEESSVSIVGEKPVPCPYVCGQNVLPTALRCFCNLRRPLKRCKNLKCLRPVQKDDPDCPFCGYNFPQEQPVAPGVPLVAIPSAAITSGPRELPR